VYTQLITQLMAQYILLAEADDGHFKKWPPSKMVAIA